MSTIIYTLFIIFGLHGQPLETVEGNYTDFSVCESVGQRQTVAIKRDDPRNFLGEVTFRCLSRGTVTGRKVFIKKHDWR